ncbi:MAG: hypothetical protein M3024_12495, partial [Candidatus Dormibacteraeota bacterium]|nr:hypothetical protein [Candidatus Dormibacteraeota bacterium]
MTTDRGWLLLTVESPAGRTLVRMPADRIVGDLLPALLEQLGLGAEARRWVLRPRGCVPCDPARTLAGCGVLSGAVLRLAQEGGEAPVPHLLPGLDLSVRARAALRTLRARAAGLALGRRATTVETSTEAPVALPRRVTPPQQQPPAAAPREAPQRAGGDSPRTAAAPGRQPRPAPAPRADPGLAATPLRRAVTVAVVSIDRGAGRTTVATLLATRLAALRPDRVAALDADTAGAGLTVCLAPSRRLSTADLAAMVAQPVDPAQLRFRASFG